MDSPWKVSLFMRPHQVPGGRIRDVLTVAKIADDAGLYSIHFGEHMVIGDRTDRYPYGNFAHHRDTPWPDVLTTLAAVAAVTARIRLATGVILLPLRPAVTVAKSVATLDVLSEGRVDLGVGVGWQPEDFASAGVPWDQRYARFEESVQACRAIWGPQPVSFRGRWTEIDGAFSLPRPVQERVPILFGVGLTEANAERIAKWGDGWCPVGVTNDHIRIGIARLRRAYERAERDPDSILVRVRANQTFDTTGRIELAKTVERAKIQRDLGVNIFAVGPPTGYDSLAGIEDFMHELQQLTQG